MEAVKADFKSSRGLLTVSWTISDHKLSCFMYGAMCIGPLQTQNIPKLAGTLLADQADDTETATCLNVVEGCMRSPLVSL